MRATCRRRGQAGLIQSKRVPHPAKPGTGSTAEHVLFGW
jgi:hypothetical protein